jgi:hypothetical protein
MADIKLSPYQIEKFEDFFNLLQNEGDGFLYFSDFLPHIDYLKILKEWNIGDHGYKRIVNAKTRLWNVMTYLAEATLSNKISKDQWIVFWGQMAEAAQKGQTFHVHSEEEEKTPKGLPKVTAIVMHTFYKIIDIDDQKGISRKEYKWYLESIGVPVSDSRINQIWGKLTKGTKDPEFILIDEMEELLKQWLINQDSENPAPGDYFPYGGDSTVWKIE